MATTSNGLVTPALSDANNPPADLLILANSVDASYGSKVANAAALPVTGKFAGQRVYIEDIDTVATWDESFSSWEGYPKAYVPVLVGVTGAATSSYIKVGKKVVFRFVITFTGAATATVTMTLPFVAAASATSFPSIGVATLRDASPSTLRLSQVLLLTSSTASFYYEQTNAVSNVTATTPWTWATGDTISGVLEYEAA